MCFTNPFYRYYYRYYIIYMAASYFEKYKFKISKFNGNI